MRLRGSIRRWSPSLKFKLLFPLAVSCACIVLLAYWSTLSLGNQQAHDRLYQRAETVARTVTYAAETLKSEQDLQRLVNSLGAEPDVNVIVAVGGKPTRVVACTRNSWIGKTLDDLPQAGFGDDLREAITTRRANFHYHRDTREVDSTIPLLALQNHSLLKQGAVMVHINSAEVERSVANRANSIGMVLVIVVLVAFSALWYMVNTAILRPINAIIASINSSGSIPIPAANDEIGVLATTLSDSL